MSTKRLGHKVKPSRAKEWQEPMIDEPAPIVWMSGKLGGAISKCGDYRIDREFNDKWDLRYFTNGEQLGQFKFLSEAKAAAVSHRSEKLRGP